MPDGKHRGRKSMLSATQQLKAIALFSTVPATAVAKQSDAPPLRAAATASVSTAQVPWGGVDCRCSGQFRSGGAGSTV